jgi:hypothetical protein
MNLVGKSREEIESEVKNKSRGELIDKIYELASFEPMFKPQTIAERRQMTKRSVLQAIRTGRLRAHKPLDNGLRVPLSAIKEWDANTALFFAEEARAKT